MNVIDVMRFWIESRQTVLPERREELILPVLAVYNVVVQAESELAVGFGQLPHLVR